MVHTMNVAIPTDPAVALHPMSRALYDDLVGRGVYDGERVELLEGVVVRMPPMRERHARAIKLLARWFIQGLPDEYEVGPQTPIGASDYSEPEPDISITDVMAAGDDHPTTAYLVIEVTLNTHRTDLRIKPLIYAAAGIPVYWCMDLRARRAVVHTDPVEGRYTSVVEVGPERVLTFMGVQVPLHDLLGGAPG